MSRRIGYWALSGFAVACLWVVVGTLVPRGVQFGDWIIVAITAPASLFRKWPVTWYEFILLNAAIYVLIGIAVEPFQHLRGRSGPV